MTNFRTMIAAQQVAALKQYNVRQVGDVDAEPITLEEARAQCRVDTWGSPPESDDDFWLEGIGMPGARMYCEQYKGAAYAQRTMELVTNGFPSGAIKLPFGPVQTVESVKYDDQTGYQAAYDAAYQAAYTTAYDAEFMSSGDPIAADAAGIAAGVPAGETAGNLVLEVTLDPTNYVLNGFTGEVVLAYGKAWPTGVRDGVNSVRVQYVTGPSLPEDTPQINTLPGAVRVAILLMLGHLYENRSAVQLGGLVSQIPLGVHAFLDLAPGGDRRRIPSQGLGG